MNAILFFFAFIWYIINFKIIYIVKKRNLKSLNLNKKSISKLNNSESKLIGGKMDSGNMLCVPEPQPDTKNPGTCPDNSGLRLCQSNVINCN